jgi:hypothetical protein
VPAGAQQRHPRRVLRRARAPPRLDPGGLDRHERRVPARHPRRRSRRRDLLRPVPRGPARGTRDRPGPPRRVERPRALAHPDRPLGQGHPLVAAQGARTPDDRPARHPLRGPAGQPRSTARSCCAKSSGCSTTCPTPRSHQRISTPGWPGLPARAYRRSSASPAPSAPTATASLPRSASASPTAAWKASTQRSG